MKLLYYSWLTIRALIGYIFVSVIGFICFIPCFIIASLPARWRYDNKIYYFFVQLFYQAALKASGLTIDIKGLENFTKGILDYNSSTPLTLQRKIVDRTAISLYRRHLPIYGYDFVNNKHTFLQNGYAQVSDLLINAYELYYLKEKRPDMSDNGRSRKILSRLNEAVSYMNFLSNDKRIKDFKKKIFTLTQHKTTFTQSKAIFNEIVSLYEEKTKHLNKNRKNGKKEVKKC